MARNNEGDDVADEDDIITDGNCSKRRRRERERERERKEEDEHCHQLLLLLLSDRPLRHFVHSSL